MASETAGYWELTAPLLGDDERYQNANPEVDATDGSSIPNTMVNSVLHGERKLHIPELAIPSMCVTLRTIASAHNDRQHYNSWVGSTGWVERQVRVDVEHFSRWLTIFGRL